MQLVQEKYKVGRGWGLQPEVVDEAAGVAGAVMPLDETSYAELSGAGAAVLSVAAWPATGEADAGDAAVCHETVFAVDDDEDDFEGDDEFEDDDDDDYDDFEDDDDYDDDYDDYDDDVDEDEEEEDFD